MKQISDFDKNFRIDTKISRDNLQFYNVAKKPFRIYGLLRENGRFCRMPHNMAEKVNETVSNLYSHTAGGRVRFITNSSYVAISAKMDRIAPMPHMPLTGLAGFDLYVDEGDGQVYEGTFVPPSDIQNGYESVIDFSGTMERVITIHFPLYSRVQELYIGLDRNAVLKEAPNYKYELPIVYYGSSITQGGCASRPGNSYQAIISRRLNMNHINLGFSGGAKGEETIARYIADLEMGVFVCDYDHNTPNAAHLKETHVSLYRTVRKRQPKLPIIFISAPTILSKPEAFQERREAVCGTYNTAVAEGDDNVYYIDGAELFQGEDWDLCTVDGVHPNDLGFYRMAMRIEKEIIKIMKG